MPRHLNPALKGWAIFSDASYTACRIMAKRLRDVRVAKMLDRDCKEDCVTVFSLVPKSKNNAVVRWRKRNDRRFEAGGRAEVT